MPIWIICSIGSFAGILIATLGTFIFPRGYRCWQWWVWVIVLTTIAMLMVCSIFVLFGCK